MKILVVCQYYYPEPFRITDICEELVGHGHEVTVITGVPNYPEGITYESYRKGKKRDEVINGVKVHRCFTVERRTGTVYRFLNYYSFAVSSWLYVSKLKCGNKKEKPFDAVFVNQLSPVMMAYAGIRAKKKWNIPMTMYCLDLWPESLVAGGITSESVIYKLFHCLSKRIYRQADKILITSEMFQKYFEDEFEIGRNKIGYLPQYAESIFEQKMECVSKETIDLMFAGNIGTMQSVDTIVKAARILEHKYANLRWHIIGSGTELENIKELVKGYHLENVIIYGRKPVEEMPKYYAMADAMLITLKDEPVISMTLPGKVQSYMAAGKPIIGAINGETKFVINKANCGFCANADDAEELANCVERFIVCKNKASLGQNARDYYEAQFTKERFMGRLEQKLEKMKQ